MRIILDLIYNLSILVSISIISSFIDYKGSKDWYKSLLQGLLMGSASIIGMLHPIVLTPGLIFDGRSVILSLSGLFFGPLTSVIAGLMALVFRIYQGGTGVTMGILVISEAVIIGTLLYIRNKQRYTEITMNMIFFMGVIVHLIMILFMFSLPNDNGISTIKIMGLPILIVYPIATVLIGRILLVNTLLLQSKDQLNSALDNAPIPIMLRAEDGEILKVSRKWTEITGYTIHDIPTISDWTTKAYGTDKLIFEKLIKDSYHSKEAKIDGEYEIITAEGKVKIWKFNSANIGNIADGRKVAMTAAMDITERKRIEDNLRVSEEKYRLLTENTSDVIWVLNLTTREYAYISPSIYYLRGLTAEEAMSQSFKESLTPESLVSLSNAITKSKKDFIENPEAPNYYINEVQQPCKDGAIIWVELSTKYRYNSDGDIEMVGVSRNIEKRKQTEQQVLYLSYRDQLTGLYNRRFYEEELVRLDTENNLPLTIVMGDVNGLKLINDSFGHAIGDELLKKVAEVIRLGCRGNDVIARLGGDEFVIILPKTDDFEAEQIINRITNLSLSEKIGSIDISISFGYETKNNQTEKIQEILKKAEDHMYKKKLFESPSMRGKAINAIMNTLYEKNKREEQHSNRVSVICKSIGEALGLTNFAKEELQTVGLLHDIGKIAIDEKILNKKDKLTNDDWEEIKRHPEIGYRILNTVNDMSDIANYVLYHHERWDGTGYPKGLKGEEIPYISRIIAIADAYDAMISERSYRSEFPKELAIQELRNNAGIQFDADLVSIFINKVLDKCSE